MQVTVESAEKLERRLKVQVPADEIEQEVASRLQRVAKTARLKGFRPGKIPAKVVRQQYGRQVRQDVLTEIMQSSFVKAVQEQNLNPAGGPSFEPVDLTEGNDLQYLATFEVYPQVELQKIDGLKAVSRVAQVSDDDVDQMIERLRAQRSTWADVDRPAQAGDQITIDFTGRVDGEAFEGGTSSDYPVTIGAGSFLKDLEDGLIGLIVADNKTIDVAFPDDYHATELAGKQTQFEVDVKAVKESVLPVVDDEFMTSFGISDGGLAEFRDAIRANMQREAADKTAGELRQQILTELVANNAFDVPKVLVDREVEQLQKDSLRRMGITDPDPKMMPPREPFEEQGAQRVALGLLIGEIIKQHDITVDKDKMEARLATIVEDQADPASALTQVRANREMMQQVEMMVLEEQVVARLIDNANVEVSELSFSDLMELK